MADGFTMIDKEQSKKAWVKPELEELSIRNTEYWEYQYDPATGFYKNVWVDDFS